MINIQKNHEKPYVQIMSCNYTKDDDASSVRINLGQSADVGMI